MIPNIFISSTISDLTYLRDSIRDLIIEIGYTPIMSEYGDIGYSPTCSAEDSCYLTMKNCQLAVLIVGKRYGNISNNGLSITHNEFKSATENKLPVIFLVDQEMISFKKVYELNEGKINIPGVENPNDSFNFIREFMNSEINNGIITFSNTQSAKDNLKKQLAHIFGDLLKNRFDPIKGEIKDILSEISTLKHILLKNEKELAEKFSKTFRFLLENKNEYLKDVSETISGSLETAVQDLLDSVSFNDYLTKKGVEIQEVNITYFQDLYRKGDHLYENIFKNGIEKICYNVLPFETNSTRANFGGEPDYNIKSEYSTTDSLVFGFGKNKFLGDKNAFKLLDTIYNSLKLGASAGRDL